MSDPFYSEVIYTKCPTIAGIRDLNRAGLEAAVDHWHGHFMPFHFSRQAMERYGYKKRDGEDEPKIIPHPKPEFRKYGRMITNPKYYWRKAFGKAKKGVPAGTTPLVFTGKSFEAAKGNKRITSRRKAATISAACAMPGIEKYFYQYRKRKNGEYVDKLAELLTTTPAEHEVLLRIVNTHIGNGLVNAPMKTRRIKISPALARQIATEQHVRSAEDFANAFNQ